MTDLARISAFGLIVFATHCLEGVTGFGCTVLALPFVILLLGIKTAVPVLVALSWVLACYIVLRSYHAVAWREFFRILLYAGIGLPVGIALYDFLPEAGLKLVLGVFMIGVGLRGLRETLRTPRHNGILCQESGRASNSASSTLCMRGCLTMGGVIHGAFGTGGPFVVIYASRALTNKSTFRCTLSMVWLTLNSLLIIQWTISGGVWTAGVGTALAGALPFLCAGMILGNHLHYRVGEHAFRILVYAVLAVAGGVILYLAAGQWLT